MISNNSQDQNININNNNNSSNHNKIINNNYYTNSSLKECQLNFY